MRPPGARGVGLVALAVGLLASCTPADRGQKVRTILPPTTRVTVPITTTTTPVNNTLVRPTGARLVVVHHPAPGRSAFAILDVDSGRVVYDGRPAGVDAASNRFQVVSRGGHALAVLGTDDVTGHGHEPSPVSALPDTLTGNPVVFGTASAIFASATADRIWMTSDLGSGMAPATVHLVEVDMTGLRTGTAVLHAPVATVITRIVAIATGFAMESSTGGADDREVTVYDGTGTAVGGAEPGFLVAAGGTTVVTTGVDGRTATFDVGSRKAQTLTSGARLESAGVLSDDERHLVTTGSLDRHDPSHLVVTAALGAAGAQVQSGPAAGSAPTWSPSGHDVLFVAPDHRHIDVWQVAERHLVRLPYSSGTIDSVCPLGAR